MIFYDEVANGTVTVSLNLDAVTTAATAFALAGLASMMI